MEKKGRDTSSLDNEVMRLLLAYCFLNRSFSKYIRRFIDERHQAIPPELGLDLNLLDQFCTRLHDLEEAHKVKLIPFGIGLLLSVCLVFAGNVGVYSSFRIWLASLFVAITLWAILAEKEYSRLTRLQQTAAMFIKDKYSSQHIVEHFDLYPIFTRYQVTSDYDRLMIYRGNNSPFVGAGLSYGGWSFVVDLSIPPQDQPHATPIPFKINEVYEELDELCSDLGVDGAVADNYYFVNGSKIRSDRLIIPFATAKPRQALPFSTLEQYSKDGNSQFRKYKWLRLYTWKDEIVISFFVRCSIQGKNLFVEARRYILLPLRKQFHQVDNALQVLQYRSNQAMLLIAILSGPFHAVGAVMDSLSNVSSPWQVLEDVEKEQTDWRIARQADYDYGADHSFRESLSGPIEDQFQWSDVQMNIKLLESCLLSTIIDFLHDHKVDTSEIKERQTTILNSGVLVQGGNISAESIAVGEKAQAVTNTKPFVQKGAVSNG